MIGDTYVSGVVLAGGASRRMGTDKALLDCQGMPLIERPLSALHSAAVDEVFVIGRSEALAGSDVCFADQYPGEGPLPAVVQALGVAKHNVVLILACDMPGVTVDVLHELVRAKQDAPAAVACTHGLLHPLLAAYGRESLVTLRELIEAGERKLTAAVASLQPRFVEVADAITCNLNTPEDVRRYAKS